MIYIGVFFVSSLLLHLSTLSNRLKSRMYLFVSICAPVLLAALRSECVGIDVGLYVAPLIRVANRMSLPDFIAYTSLDGIEIGYTILTYICANYLGGLPALLGILQLVIIACVYTRIRDYKNEAPVIVMSLIYLLLLYNRSLNLVRQCIAMSIIFYAVPYLKTKRVKFICFVALAMLFHSSAILGIIFLVFDYIASGKLNKVKTSIAILAILIAVIYYESIFGALIQFVFGKEAKYLKYISSVNGGNLSLYDVVFKGSALLMVVLFAVLNNRQALASVVINREGTRVRLSGENTYTFFLLISVFNLVLYFLTRINADSYRFSLYFQMMMPVVLPQVRKLFTKKSYILVDILLVLLALLNWYIFMIIGDGYGTIPYVFAK